MRTKTYLEERLSEKERHALSRGEPWIRKSLSSFFLHEPFSFRSTNSTIGKHGLIWTTAIMRRFCCFHLSSPRNSIVRKTERCTRLIGALFSLNISYMRASKSFLFFVSLLSEGLCHAILYYNLEHQGCWKFSYRPHLQRFLKPQQDRDPRC